MNRRQLLRRVTISQANVRFGDFEQLVRGFGFELIRQRGSHNIYRHGTTGAQLNLQNVGGQAKPYQVRQFLKLIERYKLTLEADE